MKTITLIIWKEGDMSYTMTYNPHFDEPLERYINSDKYVVKVVEIEDGS